MDLIDGIKQNNFLLIGRAGMDFCPDPPGTKTRDASVFTADLGGSAANTAAGICKLGGKAALVTSVSADPVGDFCLNKLDHYGVDRAHVGRVGGEARNSLAVYETVLDDHETVIYRNGAADFVFTVEDMDRVPVENYGAVITAGTVFAAEPSRSAAFHGLEKARAAGLPVIFDVDYRPYSWPSPQVAEEVLSKAASLSDMIVGNDEEWGFIAGGIDKGLAKAREYAASTATVVIYKMGEKGAITITKDGETQTGIYRTDALKPTGAGDSFMAGLMASLAGGHDLHDAVLRGSACAAITVSRPMCAPAMPVTQELEDFLASHEGPS